MGAGALNDGFATGISSAALGRSATVADRPDVDLRCGPATKLTLVRVGSLAAGS